MSLTAFNRRRREAAARAASLLENESAPLDYSNDLPETVDETPEKQDSPVVEENLMVDNDLTNVIAPTIDELRVFAENNKIDLGITFTVNGALKKIRKAGFEYPPKATE